MVFLYCPGCGQRTVYALPQPDRWACHGCASVFKIVDLSALVSYHGVDVSALFVDQAELDQAGAIPSEKEIGEAEIREALDFGRTAEQHLKFGE